MAMKFDIAAIQVGVHVHRLAAAHVRELHFLEVGIDPHIIQRHHGQQRRTGGDALANLDIALGDDTG